MGFSRQEYWSGVPCLLQGIFPTQGSNPGFPHCRQTLYRLSHQGSSGSYGSHWNFYAPLILRKDSLLDHLPLVPHLISGNPTALSLQSCPVSSSTSANTTRSQAAYQPPSTKFCPLGKVPTGDGGTMSPHPFSYG